MDQIDPAADHPHLRASPSIREWGSLLIAAALTIWVVYSPSSGRFKWQEVLHNTGHGPIFGFVAILLLIAARTHRRFRHWPLAVQCISAIAASAGLGLAAEGLQFFTHRDPSWMDATNDAVGAIAFVSAFAWYELRFLDREHTRRKRTALAVIVIAALAFLLEPAFSATRAYMLRSKQFPVLADFTTGAEPFFAGARYSRLGTAPLPSTLTRDPHERGLEVLFDVGPYPGMYLQEPMKDWSRYSNLVLDIANPTQDPLNFVIRVDDKHRHRLFGDRFNRNLFLDPMARRQIRIPLLDIEHGPRDRLLDLSRINQIILFCRKTCGADRMLVQKIWLE
jgi:hypothetical protein